MKGGFIELVSVCSTLTWRPDRTPEARTLELLDRLVFYLEEEDQRIAAANLRSFMEVLEEEEDEEEDEFIDAVDPGPERKAEADPDCPY
jgi:hypothetical protein